MTPATQQSARSTHDVLVVIGMGHDGPSGLSALARAHIDAARVLAGGKRHLEHFPEWNGETIVLDADLDRAIGRLKECYRQKKTVVLASGDPLFFGIGRALLEALPRDDLVFLPQVSSIQLAFSRLKETWDDACVVSVHGRPLEALLPTLHRGEAKIAILTGPGGDPPAVAGFLAQQGFAADYDLWVCENLGGPGERVSTWEPGTTWSPLSVVVLLRKSASLLAATRGLPLVGISEKDLVHRPSSGTGEGLITPRDVRLLALGHLELEAGQVFWDVGAGSGSVSCEAARLSPHLKVWAIDRDPQAIGFIRENVRNLRLGNVQIVLGEAPEKLAGLPDPDRVFVGGSGGRLEAILQTAVTRLRSAGRLVLSCITLETLTRSWGCLQEKGLNPEVTSVQLARSRPLGGLHCLEPDHPRFLVWAVKS
jgi:precorrin-6Y C5,15-methyltransferase (decarboxylating)